VKLFTVGPVQMFPQTLEMAAQQTPYFRTEEFSKQMLEANVLLHELLAAPKGAKTVMLTASGTAAMEAAIINLAKPSDNFLVIKGGAFGERFVQLCELHKVKHHAIELEFGEELTEEHLMPFQGKGFTGLLVNIHETDTGQLYNAKMLSDFCKRNNLLFVIDAISSFLADKLDMAELGADAIIISSQKALALDPGLSFVILSERAYLERVQGQSASVAYFDFDNHINNFARGQTPYTPAVNVALSLNDMLKRISECGIDKKVSGTAEIAHDFRNKAASLANVKIPDFPLSNALTTLVFSKGNAKEVFERLCEKGLMLTPNGGKLADSVLRVGHIGNHTISENDEVISALREVLEGD